MSCECLYFRLASPYISTLLTRCILLSPDCSLSGNVQGLKTTYRQAYVPTYPIETSYYFGTNVLSNERIAMIPRIQHSMSIQLQFNDTIQRC